MNRNAQSKNRGILAIVAASALGLFAVSGLAGCAIQAGTGTEDQGAASESSGTEGSSTTDEPGKTAQSAGAHESAPTNTNPTMRNANAPGTGNDPQPSPWSGTNSGQTPGTPVFRQQMNTNVEHGQ